MYLLPSSQQCFGKQFHTLHAALCNKADNKLQKDIVLTRQYQHEKLNRQISLPSISITTITK